MGLAGVAVVGLTLAVAAPANAVDGGPSSSPNLGVDIVGVGSDTTQWVMDALANSYDASVATGPRLINYDACLGDTQTGANGLGDNPDGSGFPCGADNTGTKPGVARPESDITGNSANTGAMPNGSGAGRTLLRTPTDPLFNDIAFTRSSSAESIADLNAGEVPLPFAVDKLVSVVSPHGDAPVALSGQQILKIFNGTYTNWDEVGGTNAPIHPYLPKSSSGTYNASLVFLAALDGVTEAPGSDNDPSSHSAAHQTWQGPGVTITNSNWNTGTVNVEEHDPSIILADPDAIELFSYGRAQMANKHSQTIRIEGGWSEDREQYNVVRGQKIPGAGDAAGDSTPFIYGDPTTDPSGILESIFGNTGWICTSPTASLDINTLGDWPLNSNICGKPNKSTLDTINPYGSTGVGEGSSTTTNAIISHGAVQVAVAAANGSTPTGKVEVVTAKPAVPGQAASPSTSSTTVSLVGGQASVKLPARVSGKQAVSVSYMPTDFGAQASAGGHTALGASSYDFTGTVSNHVAKVATTVRVKAKPHKLASASKRAKVTVTVHGKTGSAKPTGTVKIMLGSKVVGKGKLRAGKVVVTIKGSKLKKGKNKLTVKYIPKGNFASPARATKVTITRKK
jgi:ABC-type phosphate transport system substrate-binding protein